MRENLGTYYYLCVSLSAYIKHKLDFTACYANAYRNNELCISKLRPEITHIAELGYEEKNFGHKLCAILIKFQIQLRPGSCT